VDLCYHWIQQLIVDSQRSGLLSAPAPMVSGMLAELSSGMSKFGDAKKHATTQFNFPYAQTCKWLLVLYSLLMPMMMVQWSDWISGAFIFTFVQLFFIWTLEAITIILENPFDTSDPNCIDVFQLQLGMNGSLLLLMNPRTRSGPPDLAEKSMSGDKELDFDTLQMRDTPHKAILKKEGWILTDETELKGTSQYFDIETGHGGKKCCTCCCHGPELPKEIARSATYCTTRYGIIDDKKTAIIAIGIFGDELVVAVPPTSFGLSKSAKITVQTVSGRSTKVGVKKISIQDRHKLHKHHEWHSDDFEDFAFEFQDLPAAVYAAGPAILSLRVSPVRRQEEIAVQKRIDEAKMADKQGLGIDQINHLQNFEDFTEALMKECGLTEDEAALEWNRRKNKPTEFDHEQDPEGRLMIELDIKLFKAHLAETKRKEKEQAQRLQAARDEIQNASCSGHIEKLEKAIQVAEVDTSMTDEELNEFRQLLQAWRDADAALCEALQSRRKPMVRAALDLAEKVKLNNDKCSKGRSLWQDLVVEDAQLELSTAMGVGEIENLRATIDKARADMEGISEKGLKEAQQQLESWQTAEEVLKKACEGKGPHELKSALDGAAHVGLRSSTVALARQLLAEQTAADREELDAAIQSGTIASLESKVIEAETKAVLTADELRSAHEILEKLKSADKGLEEALASSDPIALQGALAEAEAAGLQGARRSEAEMKLKELKEAKPQEVPSPDIENGAKAPPPDAEAVALPGSTGQEAT